MKGSRIGRPRTNTYPFRPAGRACAGRCASPVTSSGPARCETARSVSASSPPHRAWTRSMSRVVGGQSSNSRPSLVSENATSGRVSVSTVTAAVEAVTVLTLTRPDVAFSLTSDGRELLDCPPTTRLIDRVHALWGGELADTLLAVSHRAGPLEVTGLAQRPAQARPAGRKGYVFVRGRPIRDPFILRAAEAGYRSTIAPGDRPSLLLFLDLPGDAVDVNVHPAKLEARFRDKFFVEKVVEEAVREALAPLEAAVPLGAIGYRLSGVGGDQEVTLPGGMPLELFGADHPIADSRYPIAPLMQVFNTYILFQTDAGVAIVDQ